MALDSIVEHLVTPKIEQFTEWCKDKYNEYLIPTAEHFEEYLNRTYDKYSIINTLVLHNSQRKLTDIYVAQTLVTENVQEDDVVSIKIDRLPVEFIKKYKKILITDSAGMGKSTIMKRMFIDLIDNGLEDVGIPIYIELSRLSINHTILDEIQEELSSLSKEFDNDLLLRFIQNGGFIFFMDGYDEISIADRIDVTKDLQGFISKAGHGNYYIMTSRPVFTLPSFGDFKSFKIQPLTKEEAFELLSKYDISPKKKASNGLIQLFKTSEYEVIDDFLKNPLLASLCYNAFNDDGRISLNKRGFYRQVYNALFLTHNKAQGINPHEKRCGLEIDDFERVLKCVGYVWYQEGNIKLDQSNILRIIRQAMNYCQLSFHESDFFYDVHSAVPFLCIDGTDYRWIHKSFMEYFAASFIADNTNEIKDKILSGIYQSDHFDKHINLLDIYYDIDDKGFMFNIILPFLEEYVEYHDKSFPQKSNINRVYIEERLGLLFGFQTIGLIKPNYSEISETDDIYRYSCIEEDDEELEFEEFEESDEIDIEEIGSYDIIEQKIMGNEYDRFKVYATYPGFEIVKVPLSMKYYYISNLLCEKRRLLFSSYDVIDNINSFDETLFDNNRVYEINVNTGDDNDKLYHCINHLLIMAEESKSYFDYQSVKCEIERIHNDVMENRHNHLDILKGI